MLTVSEKLGWWVAASGLDLSLLKASRVALSFLFSPPLSVKGLPDWTRGPVVRGLVPKASLPQ